MERKVSWPEDWERNIDYQLFSIARDMKKDAHPYPSEYGLAEPDWKLIRYLRHKASVALAYSPNKWFDKRDAEEYVYASSKECPLLPGEGKIISKNQFILPNPTVEDVPEIKLSYGTGIANDEDLVLGPTTVNKEHLKWFDPSWNFVISRIGDELDVPNKIVGVTSGKWRAITAYHMLFLWKMRQKCNFMVVAADDEKYDTSRVDDNFIPRFEEKIASLGVLKFPDGSTIDLVTKTHFVDHTEWFGGVYLPFGITGDVFFRDESELKREMNVSQDSSDLALQKVHSRLSPFVSERMLRLKYFLSNNDYMFDIKKYIAAIRGIPTERIKMPKNSPHVSDLVRKFDLRT
jgi:hypothetical protein